MSHTNDKFFLQNAILDPSVLNTLLTWKTMYPLVLYGPYDLMQWTHTQKAHPETLGVGANSPKGWVKLLRMGRKFDMPGPPSLLTTIYATPCHITLVTHLL
jgi:hypothetical protein